MPTIGKGDWYDSGRWLIHLLKLLSQPCPQESCKIQSQAPHGRGWFEVMFCSRTVTGLGDRWEMNPDMEPSPSFGLVGVPKRFVSPCLGFPFGMDGSDGEQWVSTADVTWESQRGWVGALCSWCGTGCQPLWATRALPALPVSAEGQAAVQVWHLFWHFKHKRSSPSTLHNVTLRLHTGSLLLPTEKGDEIKLRGVYLFASWAGMCGCCSAAFVLKQGGPGGGNGVALAGGPCLLPAGDNFPGDKGDFFFSPCLAQPRFPLWQDQPRHSAGLCRWVAPRRGPGRLGSRHRWGAAPRALIAPECGSTSAFTHCESCSQLQHVERTPKRHSPGAVDLCIRGTGIAFQYLKKKHYIFSDLQLQSQKYLPYKQFSLCWRRNQCVCTDGWGQKSSWQVQLQIDVGATAQSHGETLCSRGRTGVPSTIHTLGNPKLKLLPLWCQMEFKSQIKRFTATVGWSWNHDNNMPEQGRAEECPGREYFKNPCFVDNLLSKWSWAETVIGYKVK